MVGLESGDPGWEAPGQGADDRLCLHVPLRDQLLVPAPPLCGELGFFHEDALLPLFGGDHGLTVSAHTVPPLPCVVLRRVGDGVGVVRTGGLRVLCRQTHPDGNDPRARIRRGQKHLV